MVLLGHEFFPSLFPLVSSFFCELLGDGGFLYSGDDLLYSGGAHI
jgi:hypothetical protein